MTQYAGVTRMPMHVKARATLTFVKSDGHPANHAQSGLRGHTQCACPRAGPSESAWCVALRVPDCI